MQGVTLADKGPTWIQALPLGTYHHPSYGELKITPDRVQKFAASVQNKTVMKDLDIDYDHKKKVDYAAGWVTAAEARQDGLWLQVDWTPAARQKLADKEYRYFSPEYVDEWTHPKTQAVHNDVLLGGALTNRPFLKDILPINLSEVFENAYKEGGSVTTTTVKLTTEDAKLIAVKHGLPETATSEEIIAAVAAAAAKPVVPPVVEPPKVVEPPVVEPVKVPATLSTTLSDEDKKNPVLVKMAEIADKQQKMLDDQAKQLAILSTANKMQDADNKLLQLADETNGAKVILSPAARERARKIMTSVPQALSDELVELLTDVTAGKATVQLGEIGVARGSSTTNATKAFNDEVQKVRTANQGMSYTTAVTQVARSQPKLFEDYQTATMAGENDGR